ncbi:MAG: spondin domain-containing protein [Deinococcota bacterium]
MNYISRVKTGLIALLALLVLAACSSDSTEEDPTTFTIRLENVSGIISAGSSGVFNTPTGADGPGPAFPESGYSFTVTAFPGDRLSFATMFVQSNDLIFAPGQDGIPLYNDDGSPLSGDITSQVSLWDVGTEVNEEPGVGPNQAPRQAGPNTGATEFAPVTLISNVDDGFSYPDVVGYIQVTVTPGDNNSFTVDIANISQDNALAGPISPGVWVIHRTSAPLFEAGELDYGQGLEAIAEDGAAGILGSVLAGIDAQLIGPISPGVAIATSDNNPLFTVGTADRGEGLEGIAEDGSTAGYADRDGFIVFNTPDGASDAGPAFPGNSYTVTVSAMPGDRLSLATMFVQSNDIFIAPDDNGIGLFRDGEPLTGNITRYFELWDAGTEVNEEPGVGLNQAPRQTGPNTGDDENGVVRAITDVNDGYDYPPVGGVVQITITAN